MHQVRPAAVAGTFYPGEASSLSQAVHSLLEACSAGAPAGAQPPKALIVPHAGYVYSGSTAAQAYALLAPWRQTIRRVVLLGPVHRVPVRGLALPGVDALATPLGEVRVDPVAADSLRRLPQVVTSAAVHAQEHSLEVQLPFLQSVLEAFTLVPLAVGDATPEALKAKLEAEIAEIKAGVGATNRAVNVIVRLREQPGWHPGSTVNAAVSVDLRPRAIVVPEQSVVLRPAGKVVYLIVDGKAKQQVVGTGNKQKGVVEIVAGLRGGERLALDGAGFLSDGAAVNVKEAPKTAGAQPNAPKPQ